MRGTKASTCITKSRILKKKSHTYRHAPVTVPELLLVWCCLPPSSPPLQEDLPKLAEIENSLAIFCMATYGEGDPTDNAQDFHEWLQNGDTDLSGLR